MNFTVSNQENIQTNGFKHNINTTRNKHYLHRPNANISSFQKSTFCAGIKLFNSVSHSPTILKKKRKYLK